MTEQENRSQKSKNNVETTVSESQHESGATGSKLKKCYVEKSVQTEEKQADKTGEKRCEHCAISFDDELMLVIHNGLHTRGNAFLCNICGKEYTNKFEFYSHIVRHL